MDAFSSLAQKSGKRFHADTRPHALLGEYNTPIRDEMRVTSNGTRRHPVPQRWQPLQTLTCGYHFRLEAQRKGAPA